MSAGNKLLTPKFVATFVFMLLLAIHLPSAYGAGKAVTAHGNTQIDTLQSKFGGASGLFDGTGDYLSLADSVDWNFGSGDFTIDFCIRFNSLTPGFGLYPLWDQYVDDNNRILLHYLESGGWYILVVSGGVLITYWGQGSADAVVNTWYHFALVRSGNNWYIFVNGSQVASATISGTLPNLAAVVKIGSYSGAAYYLNGWLDEFRISKGIARWTSNFTPPSAAYTADSNTVLLLHMDGASGSTTFTDDYYVGPTSFSFNVKSGATQIVVTLTYSWSGSGSLPLGSIAISGPGGTPTYQESSAVVYDRTSITVSGGNTYSIMHRATFTITAPGSAQNWTASVSLSGVSSYNVVIEVS